MNRRLPRLVLHRTSLRTLASSQLDQAAGGATFTTATTGPNHSVAIDTCDVSLPTRLSIETCGNTGGNHVTGRCGLASAAGC